MFFDEARERKLNNKVNTDGKNIVYWMSRDQRIYGNWTFIRSLNLSKKLDRKLTVIFCSNAKFPFAQKRHFDFMEEGLQEVEAHLKHLNICFIKLSGEPKTEVSKYVNSNDTSILLSDFSPLKSGRKTREAISNNINCQMLEIDSHNIIPAFYASNKEEYGAYTLRPKIHKALERFLTEYPEVGVRNKRAEKLLENFIKSKLLKYSEDRNDPTVDGQSNISSYLHFGNISSQEIILASLEAVKNNPELKESFDSFFEEVVVRKELSDNFCLYNKNYDSFEGFRNWAKDSLNKHRHDKREFTYSKEEFEQANTHEDLWNASQKELVRTGKMHGYMRMYWAKKILEWSNSPEEALQTAIYLNNKYELDGRDPNGYAGIAWAIGGTHDRPWFERPIFGQIRYMNKSGCQKKFDTSEYIKQNS